MNLLELIASETNGKSYNSIKYCFDDDIGRETSFDDKREITFKQWGETETFRETKPLKDKSNRISKYPPLFKYFLDGSRRTYKVDEFAYSRRIYPIIAGQIGVGCCKRNSPDEFKSQFVDHNLVICLPYIADKDGLRGRFFTKLNAIVNNHQKLLKRGLSFDKVMYYDSGKETSKYEDLGVARIQDEMIDLEKKIVAQLTSENLLNEDSYLIKDGSLEYQKMKTGDFRDLSIIKSNYRRVIGASKRFNPELCVDHRGKSNAELIANLPLFHRTPAFQYESTYSRGAEGSVLFSIWYLRIRDSKYTSNPLDGILKLEKILVTEDEINNGLESDEIDLISANIINERNPVAFGSDSRWANHLYPVFLTEKYIKSKYLSDVHFLNLFN